MAAGPSVYLKNELLDAVFNNGSFAVAQPYVQLHTGDPGDGTANRVSIAREALSSAAADAGAAASDATMEFETMPAAVVSWVSLWDGAGTGTPPTGGNLLWNVQLTSSVTVPEGETFSLLSGDVTGSIS